MAQRPEAEALPIRAAQYLRMSTEHQRYSLEHQSVWIAAYAAEHGYEVVKTYSDAGKSGLRIQGREALSNLLKDVVGGQAEFDVILVLDVSRWGRFQDPDQAAHYEFICKSAGVRVEYCAEAFENDGSVMSALLKQFKRAMAAEYSRELSVKITKVQRELAAKGFRQGGPAGYGYRRQVLNDAGQPGAVLATGEQKAVHSFRVILTPGPPEEVATVQRIFRLYVIAGMSEQAIVELLNAEGSRPEPGRRWTRARVNRMLTDEKYVGTNLFGRYRRPLATTSQLRTPRETWVSVEDAFEPLVSRMLFEAAGLQLRRRFVCQSESQMLDGLRDLWAEKGYLSSGLIAETQHLPSTATYFKHFGGLVNAYRLIGYRRGGHDPYFFRNISEDAMIERLAALLAEKGRLSSALIDASSNLPSAETYKRRFGTLAKAYARVGFHPTGVGTSRRQRGKRFTDRYLLDRLGELYRAEGYLTWVLINQSDITPSPATYIARFKGLRRAYEMVGYIPMKRR
jgi:DNA invertase Pin-like site-specific DNA recombinase